MESELMRKKTESLTFPKDAVAAMRELQELNTPSKTQPEAERGEAKDPESPLLPESRGELKRPDEEPSWDPIQTAILEMLGKPSTSAPGQGPFTVTSIKMNTDLWERLGWVSRLTGQTKQELVAEALAAYLDKIRLQYTLSAKAAGSVETGNPTRGD